MRVPRVFRPALGCLLLLLAGAAVEAPGDANLQVLKQGNIGTDGASLLEFFRKRTPGADHRAGIPNLIRLLDSKQFTVRQEASQTLEEYGVVALPFLRAAGRGKSLEMSRRVESCIEAIERNLVAGLPGAAARLLRQRKPDGACGVLLAYLPYADDREVEEELLATLLALGLPDGKADAELVTALTSQAPVQRAAAALVVSRSVDPAQRQAARKLLADRDASVRFRAAQALLRGGDRAAMPVLLGLLTDSPPDVALQAEEMLVRLAAVDAPRLALQAGDPVQRARCKQAWNDWWSKRGATIAIPKIEDFRCLLGYTLVAEYGMGGASDRLVELGPDGRPRWRIENLAYPTDAVVLGDNRVLIVEHGASRVCERDFKGTILWQKEVNDRRGPYAAQRLSNGHTFIVFHHQLLEVDRDGKEIDSRQADGFQFLGAYKLDDGQVVYLTDKGDCVRLDAAGKVVKTFLSNHATHWVSGIDVLPGGNVLVPQHELNKVVEFDPEGNIVWEAKVSLPKSATRLRNGRTLVTSFENRHVIELDGNGQTLWEYKEGLHPYRARRR